MYTAKNPVISPNFLLWKFCGKAQFPEFHSCPKLCGNCAFPQNFHTRKLGQITGFFAVIDRGEAVVPGSSIKKVSLKISRNSQENSCTRISFLIRLQEHLFYRTPPASAFEDIRTIFVRPCASDTDWK